MNTTFDPERSGVVRALLVDAARVGATRRKRSLWAALVVVGAVAGAGLSTAALAATGQLGAPSGVPSGEPTPTLPDAIDAPAGTLPGTPVTVVLGDAIALSVTTETTYPLTDRPQGATHARVTVTPLTGGWLYWGTDPSGNNPSANWPADETGPENASRYDFPLDSTTTALYLTPRSGFTGVVSIQYITQVPTHLATNVNGETYGVEDGPDGTPDLVAVWATAPDGSQLQAYVRTSDLTAFSPDHPGQPSSPAQALEWQAERGNDYPRGWDIPAFESDGVTQVGTFHVG